jgi:hypothetical protein
MFTAAARITHVYPRVARNAALAFAIWCICSAISPPVMAQRFIWHDIVGDDATA